jgi:hypothetical protein
MTEPTVAESESAPVIPEWAQGLWDQFKKSLREGWIIPLSTKRHKPHQRIYTKAYADRRQKCGGPGYHYVQSQIVPKIRPAPAPSAKARTRTVRRAAATHRGIRQALFGKRG